MKGKTPVGGHWGFVESGRRAHLNGQVVAALMAKAPELLPKPPVIEKVDVPAAKLTQQIGNRSFHAPQLRSLGLTPAIGQGLQTRSSQSRQIA